MRVRSRATGGFTLVELLIVTAILGILASIAVPNFSRAISRADAAKIMTDVHAVNVGVRLYFEEFGALPASGAWGTPPPALQPYIPDALDWSYKTTDYRLATQTGAGTTSLVVRYPINDPIGLALQRFASTEVTWTKTRTTFWFER